MKQPNSITGRDGYIVAQALYQAIKYQESLKDADSTHYEWSNQQDMKAILNNQFPHFAQLFELSDPNSPNLTDEKRTEKETA